MRKARILVGPKARILVLMLGSGCWAGSLVLHPSGEWAWVFVPALLMLYGFGRVQYLDASETKIFLTTATPAGVERGDLVGLTAAGVGGRLRLYKVLARLDAGTVMLRRALWFDRLACKLRLAARKVRGQ